MHWRRRAGGQRTRLVAAALLVLCGCAAMSPPSPAAAPSRRPFILTFWCGPPHEQFDDSRAAEIAAAGFNVVGSPCQGGFDPGQTARALDVAQRHGLGMWVTDHRFDPDTISEPDFPARLEAAVREYGEHPALAGYVVFDEPVVMQFEGVGVVVAALRAADPDELAYVNLLPDYIPPSGLGAASYDDYVEQFITTVHPQILSYDYYPFGKEKDRSTFFANLAAIRAAALRHDLPFMLIVLAMPHGPYRDPTEGELAWQVHHALAYGARGISYFTYWTPGKGGDWNNRNGLIENGRTTAHYFEVSRINRGVRALASALEGFRSIAVADSLGEIGVPFPIGPIAGLDGGPITAGLFGDGNGRLAVLLVNRDYRYGVTAQVRLAPGAAAPQAFDVEAGGWRPAAASAVVLPPGGTSLLCWSADARGCA